MTVHLPTVSALSETGAPPKHVFALCCRRHHPESLRITPSRSRGIRAQIYGPALETDLSPGVYNLATCMRLQMDVLPRRVTGGIVCGWLFEHDRGGDAFLGFAEAVAVDARAPQPAGEACTPFRECSETRSCMRVPGHGPAKMQKVCRADTAAYQL